MSEKILYYFGAGASAQVLPLARSTHLLEKETTQSLLGLAESMRKIDFKTLSSQTTSGNMTLAKSIVEIGDEFIKLSQNADKFGDIDTYAKYLHLLDPGGEELNNLKQNLSRFFAIRQILEKVADSRYLPWLVSIMNTKRIPDNVKILSWNYDFQIELAASEFNKTATKKIGQFIRILMPIPILILR